MKLFTSGEVRRLVGISQRQLSHWDASGLLRPHGRAAEGSGSRRLYTIQDVLLLKIIRRLRESGLSVQKIRRAFDFLSELPDEPAPLAELEVMTDGRKVLIRRSDDALLEALAHQYVLRFPIADLLTEVQTAIIPQPDRETKRSRPALVGGRQP